MEATERKILMWHVISEEWVWWILTNVTEYEQVAKKADGEAGAEEIRREEAQKEVV